MILEETYKKIIEISERNYINTPMIVGGVPRDIYLNHLGNGDIDLTTNDADCPRLGITLSQEGAFGFKMFEDGHVSVYAGDHAIDFSSNFISKAAVEYIKSELGVTDVKLHEVYSRDFTINTLHKGLLSQEILDPIGFGEKDLSDKMIKPVTTPEICFGDDPRRIFRAINFASRLGLRIDGSIVDYARDNVDFISSEIGKSIRDAFMTSIISESISNNAETALGYLLDMRLLSLVPLTGNFKEELIKRKMVARYLDDSSIIDK